MIKGDIRERIGPMWCMEEPLSDHPQRGLCFPGPVSVSGNSLWFPQPCSPQFEHQTSSQVQGQWGVRTSETLPECHRPSGKGGWAEIPNQQRLFLEAERGLGLWGAQETISCFRYINGERYCFPRLWILGMDKDPGPHQIPECPQLKNIYNTGCSIAINSWLLGVPVFPVLHALHVWYLDLPIIQCHI